MEIKSGEKDPTSKEETPILGVYSRRWIVLLIACFTIFCRGFSQSCYGPINNILVHYFDIYPWQADAIILTQSVVFLSMTVPLSWITSHLGFKKCYVLMTVSMTIAFGFTTIGVSHRSGYPWVIVGQVSMGFSNIMSWSIPSPTAAIWFPSNEVATAVALQVVGRGMGGSVGSVMSPLIVNGKDDLSQIGKNLAWMFLAVLILAFALVVLTLIFVKDEPPLPPSESRAKAKLRENNRRQIPSFRETFSNHCSLIKELLCDMNFLVAWFAFGVSNPVLRNNSVLLSSTLNLAFTDESQINIKSGYILMGSWISYTLGGFIAGPLLTKTQKYKPIVLISVALECAASITVVIGVWQQQLVCIHVGTVIIGFFQGTANTSLFEMIREITYPLPPMFISIVTLIGLGIFRLLYPIVGRILLSELGAIASTLFPATLLLIATVLLIIISPPYKRRDAERGELQRLLHEEDQ